MREVLFICLTIFSLKSVMANNPELVIGEERVEPGIVYIFEGAIKDHVMPMSMHLSENETHVHIEARVNWDSKNVPKGTVHGGFVPYMYINAKVTNENTGLSTFIDLVPHINLIDNFHYARNIALPGSINDLYNVQFKISPPSNIELALHNDWLKEYGKNLLTEYTFNYRGVNFKQIAERIN